jgi:hypothetical protein
VLRPEATEEVFCSKPNQGPREKKTGPRKIDAEPENQQVHEKKILAKEKNLSGKDSTRNLLPELRKSLGHEAEGTRTGNRSRPRSDSRNQTPDEEHTRIVQICHKKTSSGRG